MTTETMQAAFWCGPQKLELKNVPVPKIEKGAVLVKVQSCSICGSDLRIMNHGNERIQAPKIIGHEIAGEIVETGTGVTGFQTGDRVSVGADIPCGHCKYCRGGMPNCCGTNYAIGYQFDGGFAQYILLPELVVSGGPLQKFSKNLSFDAAALGEPLACCINGYEVGLMAPGKSVVIFGAGPIGLMLAMLAPQFGASEIIMIDPKDSRLALARAINSNIVTLNPEKDDIEKRVKEVTQGFGADLVFTACPVVQTHELAIKLLAKRGVVNFFGGLPKSAPPITVSSNQIHYNELYITGSHGSTPRQHKRAVELLESGAINGEFFVSDKFKLSEIHSAFDRAMSQDGLKVVINPHG